MKFGIRLPEKSSSFKKALLALEPGAKVSATSVGGDFVLPTDDSPLLLVAGGIGITPYISQLEHRRAGAKRDVARLRDQPSRRPRVRRRAREGRLQRVTVVSARSRPSCRRAGRGSRPQRLTGDQLLAAVPDAKSRHTYLSGTPAMVGALKTALRRAGVRRIHTDVFIGY